MRERSEQEQIRIEKLKSIKARTYPYPNDVKLNATAATVLAEPLSEPPASGARFTVAGRIVQRRIMGKASFVHILDREGKLQAYVRGEDIGAELYEEFKHYDIGDIIELTGYAFVTKTGEKSLHAEKLRLLTKSLIPLPEKWHGLSDPDARYRFRYVDLISNAGVRDIFVKRAKIISSLRKFLDERGYVEVETPILSSVASGAVARPFSTHFNALSADMFLRIAPELPLKKLVVGGLERVYEIGKNFRNEGLSKKHNPEFTSIEFYQAYATYEDLMAITEEFLSGLVRDLYGDTKVSFAGKEINFTAPFKKVSMRDSLHEIGGVGKEYNFDSLEDLLKIAEKYQVHVGDKTDWGRVLEALWGHLVEPKIVDPVFITHHPLSISPFARTNQQDDRVTDRFELVIAGMEIANAFSELNDPEDQYARFLEQAKQKAGGSHEVAMTDDDFIRALEYGMPPTAGEGIGIDRLVMLLTDSPTIREVVLFPQLKPGEGESLSEKEE